MSQQQSSTDQLEASHSHGAPQNKNYLLLLTLGALGVVFGDIGTSPLYALRECFHTPHNATHGLDPSNPLNILGVLSLIFWALILEIALKYLCFVMRADNKGEGGVLALMALAAHPQSPMAPKDKRKILILLGLFGSALLYGDGIITPAISVLSAVEGLKIATSVFDPYVIPITITILILIFSVQQKGTGKVGIVFGPIILLWFSVLGLLGVWNIFYRPDVIRAVNPYYAWHFLLENGHAAFIAMGSVFLAVTGGEALYADMGHFGKKPIRIGWTYVVLPGLVLNYFGQGALLLNNPELISNPFYLMAPSWGLIPLVILATLATVIASQALISGAFSLTRQAVQLGCLPRLTIKHTSSQEIGQIYVPLVNNGILFCTILFVLSFKTSSAMAAAYGIAVSTTMIITTVLIFFVSLKLWKWSLPKAILTSGVFLLIDLVFFSANVLKIKDGGWVPLAFGLFVFTLMATWRTGRQILARRLRSQTVPFDRFRENIKAHPPIRVPGTAIFMTGNIDGTPPALIHNLRHNKVLHQTVVLLMVKIEETPYVNEETRVSLESLENNLYRLTIRCGFMETPDVPAITEKENRYNLPFDKSNITYFLGRETVLATEAEGMAIWREKLFSLMTRNAARATTYYCIPSEQVIEIGLQIEI